MLTNNNKNQRLGVRGTAMETRNDLKRTTGISVTAKRMAVGLASIGYLAITTIASAQIIPPPPEPVSKQNVARCSSRIGSFKREIKQDPKQVNYSPQAGWAIVSYRVVVEDCFGVSTKDWSSVPANYSFSSNSEVTNTFNSAINLAISAGVKGKQLADLKAELTNSSNAYYAYHHNLTSSHATISLMTNAKGRGTFVDKGSGCAIHLDVVEVQIDPNMKTSELFKTFVMNKTEKAIANLKRRRLVLPDSRSLEKIEQRRD